jgi:hypothetical protein
MLWGFGSPWGWWGGWYREKRGAGGLQLQQLLRGRGSSGIQGEKGGDEAVGREVEGDWGGSGGQWDTVLVVAR